MINRGCFRRAKLLITRAKAAVGVGMILVVIVLELMASRFALIVNVRTARSIEQLTKSVLVGSDGFSLTALRC